MDAPQQLSDTRKTPLTRLRTNVVASLRTEPLGSAPVMTTRGTCVQTTCVLWTE
jgi:hypothetical protein